MNPLRCPKCDTRLTKGLPSSGKSYCLDCGWEGYLPKPKKHDHRGSIWIISNGRLLWCYQCGAWGYNVSAEERKLMLGTIPAWYRPTGLGGPNPAVGGWRRVRGRAEQSKERA